MKRLSRYAFLTFAMLWPVLTRAQTRVMQPSKDNTLYEDPGGALSNGSGDFLFIGRVGLVGASRIRRTLLAFPIADTVPSGSTIVSVTLTLEMSRSPAGAKSSQLRRILTDWGEGASNANGREGIGISAETGDATWRNTFYNTAEWTAHGGDFSTVVSSVAVVAGFGSYTWGSSLQMVADVQSWLDTPSTNFGWILIGDESTASTAKRFDSREFADPTLRPTLRVQFVPGPCGALPNCDDGDVCTFDFCVADVCTHTPNLYGDVNHDTIVNIFDVFCILDGFAGIFDQCFFADADVEPCVGNQTLNIFDLFAVLHAFSGTDPCCALGP